MYRNDASRRASALLFVFATTLMLVAICPVVAMAQVAPGQIVPVTAFTPMSVATTVLGMLIGLLTSAYNTGSIFGVTTLPKPALPWIGLVLAGAIAAAGSLAMSGSLTGVAAFNAGVAALMAMVAKGTGVAMHVASNPTKFVNPWIKGGSGGDGGNAAPVQAVPPAPAPSSSGPATIAKMVAVATIVFAVVAVAFGSGCSWLSSNGAATASEVGQLAACVIGDLTEGKTNAGTILSDCKGVALSDVEQIIASLFDYYTQPQVDGGAPSNAKLVENLKAAQASAKAARGQQ